MRLPLSLLTRLLLGGAAVLVLVVALLVQTGQTQHRPTITTEDDFHRAMKELSNWGRWGKDDELGAANLITPAKRKQAVALVKEGLTVSLAHEVFQEKAVDAPTILERVVLNVGPTGAADRYRYTDTYHGATHSHLDAVDCHVMYEGKGYNGVSMEEVKAAGGCPRGNIDALRDGIVTRGVLFDATLLPGKAGPTGWVEIGTAIHREDLEALEKIEHVKVAPGDVILLYTGRWKRRAAMGPWSLAEGLAGYHADVAYFLKERGVSLIGNDGVNDVHPSGIPMAILQNQNNPLHRLALVALGVNIFDNLDFERAAEVAKRLNRYEFLFMAAPLRIEKGMGSPINPVATF
jgi:kynurenine formamidase